MAFHILGVVDYKKIRTSAMCFSMQICLAENSAPRLQLYCAVQIGHNNLLNLLFLM